jgi:thymidine kinase
MGHLTVLMGCMFAQKTTELLRRIRRSKAIGHKVLVVNCVSDTRYGTNRIASHDVDSCDAICVKWLQDVAHIVESGDYQVVVIDEGQFYGDLFPYVTRWADTLPIHIVVAGLDGDSNRAPFGDMLRLIPHAEEVDRLTAFCGICKDGTVACFSKRLVPTTEQVAIGGKESYVPVCRRHYNA